MAGKVNFRLPRWKEWGITLNGPEPLPKAWTGHDKNNLTWAVIDSSKMDSTGFNLAETFKFCFI